MAYNIDKLLKHADPEGWVYEELLKVKDLIDKGIPLGTKQIRALTIVEKYTQNIECIFLKLEDVCVYDGGKKLCRHIKNFRACGFYEEVKG